MAKKKKPLRRALRNAAPSTPRAPRRPNREETPLNRLGYTAAGAGATALAGSLLAQQGWAPKTIAGMLAAVGGTLAWRGDDPMLRNVGAGMASAAASQLAMMLINDRPVAPARPSVASAPKRQAEALPPGALEAALQRAQARLALSAQAQSSVDGMAAAYAEPVSPETY